MLDLTPTELKLSGDVCVCVCVFIKLHITAQSSLVILVILCHSHWSSQGGINNTCYENLWSNATKGTHSLYLYKSYLSPEHLVLLPLLPCCSPGYPSWQPLNQSFLFYVFFAFHPCLPRFPHGVYSYFAVSCAFLSPFRPPQSYFRSRYRRPRSHLRYSPHLRPRSRPRSHPVFVYGSPPPSPSLFPLCVFSSHLFWTSGCTSRGHTEGRSHRIFRPPSFCGACLHFSREKDPAVPFPRRPWSRILCTNELIVLHLMGIYLLLLFLVRKNPSYRDSNSRPVSEGYEVTNWATGDRLILLVAQVHKHWGTRITMSCFTCRSSSSSRRLLCSSWHFSSSAIIWASNSSYIWRDISSFTLWRKTSKLGDA